jgi:hypothetical protein
MDDVFGDGHDELCEDGGCVYEYKDDEVSEWVSVLQGSGKSVLYQLPNT